ncbi:O-antigen ligase family protein [Candidatus Uhrbacteria bacterium]|nr:O-antigen ligase family protein [Candidatus Uhrbacteria bacterium]
MLYLLLTTYYLLFALLAWKRLHWAVLLIIATLPSYLIRFHLGPIPITLLEGMILIVVAVWLLRQLRAKGLELRAFETLRSTLYALRWPLALFLIAATAAMFVAPDWRAAAGIWKAYFIEPTIFFLILLDLKLHHPALLDNNKIIRALSVSALLLSVYAICQRLTGFGIPAPWDAELRVTSIFPYPNALGLFLAPLIPLMIGMLIESRSWKIENRKFYLLLTTYYLLAIISSIIAIAFAKSTGALVGIGAGLITMGILWLRQKSCGRTQSTVVALGIFATLAALLLIFSLPARDELLLRDWSGHVRRTQWSETIVMLKDHPLLGAGLAGYPETLKPYHKATYIEIFQYPHNIVLNFWSETGLLGLLAFAWLTIIFFRIALLNTRNPSQPPLTLRGGDKTIPPLKVRGGGGSYELIPIAAMASMTVLLVHGLVDVPYFKNDLAILFWIVYALGVVNNKNSYATSNQTLQTH